MTKKDYILIAGVFMNSELDCWYIEQIAKELAKALASKNPRFNKEKFLKACGIEIEQKSMIERMSKEDFDRFTEEQHF